MFLHGRIFYINAAWFIWKCFSIVLLKPEFLESFGELVTKIRNSKLCFFIYFFNNSCFKQRCSAVSRFYTQSFLHGQHLLEQGQVDDRCGFWYCITKKGSSKLVIFFEQIREHMPKASVPQRTLIALEERLVWTAEMTEYWICFKNLCCVIWRT